MTPVRNWGEALMSSFSAALALFFGAIPKIIGFLVIVIIGWIISGLLATAVASLLRALRFDDLAERSGFGDFVRQTGVRADPSALVADLAKWFVRLIVLVVAFDALGLPAVSQVLQQLLLWLPNLVVALVVLVVAGLAANALHGLVRGAAAEGGFGNPDLLATIARAAVWGFAIIVAVDQIGVGEVLVNTLFTGLLGALALAVGIALGLGGRETAARIVAGWYRGGQPPAPGMARTATAGPDGTGASPTGASALGFDIPELSRQTLALEAERQASGNALTIRLPVRAERVSVDKRAFVTEEVEVRPSRVQDVVQIEETVRREQLEVETRGDVEVEGRDAGRRGRGAPDEMTRPDDGDQPRRPR
jgi:hypothetical protein